MGYTTIAIMYNYPCTWTFTTKNKITLSTTKSKFIHSSVDHPKKTRCQAVVHSSVTDSTVPLQKNVVPMQEVPKLVTSKEQILSYYPDVFWGIGRFPCPPYHIQLDPSVTPKQTPYHPIPVYIKEVFSTRS